MMKLGKEGNIEEINEEGKKDLCFSNSSMCTYMGTKSITKSE